MWWRRSSSPLVPAHASPVPDAEALRQAMLQASWQRSQRVARRRLAWRWLSWFGLRYALPALLLAVLVTWFWQFSPFTSELTSIEPPLATTLPALTSPSASPIIDTPVAEESVTPDWVRFSPEGEELPVPLTLSLERSWNEASRPTATVTADSTAADTGTNDIHPHLKPENWLHSKEP